MAAKSKNNTIVETNDIGKLLCSKTRHIQGIIQSTLLSIQTYKSMDIFSNSEVNAGISLLNELYQKTRSIVEMLALENTVETCIDMLQKIVDKLSLIIGSYGTKNMTDLLFITMGSDSIDCNVPIMLAKYDLIKQFVHPTGYKIINWTKKMPKKNEAVLCSDKIVSNVLLTSIKYEHSNHLECYDIDDKSFHYSINGLRIVIQNEKLEKTFVINGLIDDVALDWLDNSYVSERKRGVLENTSQNAELLGRIVDVLSIKDILVCGPNDIYARIDEIAVDVNYVKTEKLDLVIKSFLAMELINQRKMLINLMTYGLDNEIHYIAYMLYDLMAVKKTDETDSREQTALYDSFPWKIKNLFKNTMLCTIKYTQGLKNKYNSSSISLEHQIYMMKVPELVKEKAMAKYKEFKGKSDDTGAKAKQYLEGLLAIPFGTVRTEPLLKKVKDINAGFSKIVLKSREFMDLSDCTKANYANIEILKNIQKITAFMETRLFDILKGEIGQLNAKQLKELIKYVQKAGIQVLSNSANHIVNDRINRICSFIESTSKIMYHQTAIYDIIHPVNGSTSLSKMTADMSSIKDQILDIENSMGLVTEALNASIYGHNNAKNQILKVIGQWMCGEPTGYCFGFEGSPGIGKTSLAKKGLANCLKDEDGVSRPFSFIAVGGSCNGSTLEGHSYTYVNSTWGRIVDILMETKCMNPIIYVDELDKVSKTEHGKEIIGILTHLIDPTQNEGFQDKYFSGIDIDLSKALFIFSYNDPEQIDRILLDRIHRIKFDNLSLDDKLVVVKKYILPEINKKMAWSNIVDLSDDIIEYMVETYTSEPGVRKLKEVLFDLYGEINIEILKCKSADDITLPIKITRDLLDNKYLKTYHKLQPVVIHDVAKIGVINGLWANALGRGGIIQIETVFCPAGGFLDLKLTGMQGDVMKESMNVAKSLAWSLTPADVQTALKSDSSRGIHIHCPEGAVSKDGPSAGTAITIALYSLLNKRAIKNTVAITGEINLCGDVTAIGGLDCKILGGIRAGVKKFLYPVANHRDFCDFKAKYDGKAFLSGIEFVEVAHISDVFEHVFIDISL